MRTTILARAIPGRRTWSRLTDLVIFAAVMLALFGVYEIGRRWIGPVEPAQRISLDPWRLPGYAAVSLVRIALAYFLSLAFAIVYGYATARSVRAERVLLPLLDILQSIPVLSFLPGVMLAMVAIFPHHQIGVELGAILLIFTGQVWNMAFSFYGSLRSIPRELREAARIYRFPAWQRFLELELPSGAIGLVWNSMMSVAGGWFFLMACEMFVLGKRDFRLPGLGSYLQTAASAGDTRAILWGIATMIGVIVALDQFVWRPIIAWAEKFKFEQVESAAPPRSPLLAWLRASGLLHRLRRDLLRPARERLVRAFAPPVEQAILPVTPRRSSVWRTWLPRILAAALLFGLLYLFMLAVRQLGALDRRDLAQLSGAAGLTFLRVHVALLLGALWAVPAGVAIGLNARLARVAQPLVQIAASVPATALFPIVVLLLVRIGGGMGTAALALMLLGTQWYILFNVIAGAMAIPGDLREAAEIYRFGRWERWRRLILPGIFPYLVTGLVTAAGGAWNASIVAEYFHFRGETLTARGLGAIISRATDEGHMDLLLAATIVMATVVVVLNRLVWQRLYRLAHTRFKLEG